MKKTLIKRTISFKSLFILLFFIAVLKDHPLPAIIHNVSNTAQLQAAINAANIAGPADSIFFTGPITLTAPLPAVTNTYVIDGNSQILDGGSAYRGFLVLGASPTIQDLGIQNVVAVGGAGGGAPNQTCGSGGGGLGAGAGVYAGNGAMPILSNVTVTNPVATGGAAPLVPGGGGQGGGGAGGGLGGDGGAGLTGGTGGGGGGGGYLQGDNGAIGGAGVGGAGGVTNGGMGASTGVAAIAGGYGGGGGGASGANSAGGVSAGGGFGAGGGAGSSRPNNNPGSPAGFGAGGGGAGRNGTGGAIVYGGGVGGNGGGGNGARGGGGAALGGAIFTDTTSTVTMMTAVNPFFGSALFPGAGANPGITSGLDLFLASGGNFRFDITAGTVTLTNPIEADTINSTGGVEKLGPGTLNFSGLANTYQGSTTITAGTLQFDADGNLGAATTNVVLNGGIWEPTITPLTSNKAVSITAPSFINTPAGFNFTYSGLMTGGSGYTKTGGGTFIPTGANVGYSGTTILSAGTIQVSADNPLGTGTLDLNGGVFEATASFSSPRLVSITGPATIQTTGAGTTLTFNGSIGGGALSLDKTGAGTLELGGVNTFTVPTTVTTGLLRLIGVGTLGNAGDLNLIGGGFEIATGAGTKTIGALTGAGTGVNLNNNILQIASGNYTGVITGTGGITKYGIGTLDLFGVNNYTGQSTITGGVLRLSGGGTLGTNSPLNITSGVFEIAPGAGPKTIGTLTGGGGGINLNNNSLLIPDGNFSGPIIGTGAIQKISPGTLTLSGPSNYSGGTVIVDGTLIVGVDNHFGTGGVIMQGGVFQPSATFATAKNFAIAGPNPATINTPGGVDLTISGVLSGAFPLTKSGAGILSLSGANTITGLTSLTGGTIVLNSSALGGVTMSPGTFLEGVGTINGDLFNAGTISPGFAIGAKTITGNYTQTAGGTYIVEIEPGGTSDLLNIGGTATLDGTVDLQPLPGVYLEGSTFLVVDAAGGLGGTQFSNLIESHPLTFGINYTPTQAFIYILSSQTVIPESPTVRVGGNAQAFLDYLFCDDGSYMPVEPDIVYVLQNLTSLSPEDFVQEIELLTPGQFRGLPLTGLQNSMRAGQTILSRLNSHDFRFQERCHDEKQSHAPVHDVWFQPLGYYYQQDKRENGTGFDVRSYGFSSGTTLVFGDHLTLGIGTSYLYSNLHWKENAGIAKMHTISLGPTIGWIEKNWFVNFLALGGRTFYDVDRMIRFAKIQRVAHNDHKSWDLQGTLSGGYRYRVPNSFMRNFYLQPEVNLSVVAIIESGYQERGSQSLDLDVKSKHSSFFRSQIDLRMIKDFHINNTCVSPSLRVGWLKDTSLQNGKYQSSLYGIDSCKSYFVTKTVSKTVDQLVLGAETIISPHDHFSFELKYEANIGSRSVIQEGTARLLWDF